MKKLEINDFLNYKFLSAPAISPDGSKTAFVVNTADLPKNGYKGDIYIVCNETGKVRRLTSMGDAKSFSWTKDGTVLFSALRNDKDKKAIEAGEEFTVFYEICPNGGEAAEAFRIPLKVTGVLPIDSDRLLVSVLYDLKRPCVEGLDKAKREEVLSQYKNPNYLVFDEVPFWFNGRGIINGKRNRLYIYTRSTGELEAITEPEFETHEFQINGDVLVYSGQTFDNVLYNKDGLYIRCLKTGKTATLIEPNNWFVGAFGLMDDCVIVGLHDGKIAGMGQYPHFYKISLEDFSMSHLADYEASVGSGSVNSDSRLGGGKTYKVSGDKLYFITTIVDHAYLRYVDKAGNVSPLLTEKGSTDVFDINGDFVAFVGLRGLGLSELYFLKDGKEQKVTGFNDKVHEDTYVAKPEELFFTDKDGVEIHGWVLKPYDYKEGNSYPAILHIHGGPRTVFSDCFHHEMELWASQGYFVLYSNPRGGDGRGNEFGDLRGKYGTIDYDDLMMFTDECLKKYPAIDKNRLGVTGGSYGGFMTNWIIGHTDRFKCACAQRSISNWLAFEGTSDIGHTFTADQVQAGVHNDYQRAWATSPLKYADNATTPTLFIHSDEDYRCWMVDALSMFMALKLHNVPSKIVLFKGENHDLSRGGRPQHRIKRMEEITEWMNHYLSIE